MARNIIEFGYGNGSSSRCEDGDNLLASEPMLDYYPEVYLPDADLNFFKLDSIAIAGYDGECEIKFNKDDIEHALTPFQESVAPVEIKLFKFRV